MLAALGHICVNVQAGTHFSELSLKSMKPPRGTHPVPSHLPRMALKQEKRRVRGR